MAVDFDALVIGPCIAVFGEAVMYYGEAIFPITGVFDEAYLELTPLGVGGMSDGNFGAVSTEKPVLGVQLSQFPVQHQPEQDDTLVVVRTNATYRVKEVRVDGHGGAKLLLNLQAGIDP
ncbi:head-tail joining protein [Rhodopila sp.]|uniref:head-tail joining protein n=1 Tax=Rhodopila sp. TaxID=2480087 RepID=UPI003D09DBC8